MVTKAIVSDVSDKYNIKVRIPIYNRVSFATQRTVEADLPSATSCVLPNSSLNLRVGDIVYVSFEDDDTGRPVILGCLFKESGNGSTASSISAESINVTATAVLPSETSIGKVTSKELGFLTGMRENTQYQIDALTRKVDTSGGDIGDLTERVEDLEEDVGTLQDDVSEAQGNISSLQDSMSAVQGDVEGISSAVTDITDRAVWKNSVGSQTITRSDGDTPLYLQGNDRDETYIGFRRRNGNDLGFIGVTSANEPVFYSSAIGDNVSMLISSNIKSSRVYNNYSRKIFKGSFGFLPDIGSSGSATFTFTGYEGHSPGGSPSSQSVVSHRLTAWACTEAGKTGASSDSNYYKLVILQMPASLLDLDAIGSRTFMIPKGNTVTLTVSGIGSSAKSIWYIANGTWANTSTGE